MNDNLKNILYLLGRNSLLISVIIPALLIGLGSTAYMQIEQNSEIILEKGRQSSLPVKIVQIKSKVGVIEANKAFSAGEDWFKNFNIKIQNKSDKILTYASLKLIFYFSGQGSNELPYGESLSYGIDPLNPKSDLSTVSIKPEENLTIELPDENFTLIKENLKKLNKSSSPIRKVKLLFVMLGFSDGTVWVGGKMFKQDQSDPTKLVPVVENEKAVNIIKSALKMTTDSS